MICVKIKERGDIIMRMSWDKIMSEKRIPDKEKKRS